MPILKIAEQTGEEIKHAIQSKIHVAVREAWNDFPAHVRRKDLTDDFGVSARFVEPAHDDNVFV